MSWEVGGYEKVLKTSTQHYYFETAASLSLNRWISGWIFYICLGGYFWIAAALIWGNVLWPGIADLTALLTQSLQPAPCSTLSCIHTYVYMYTYVYSRYCARWLSTEDFYMEGVENGDYNELCIIKSKSNISRYNYLNISIYTTACAYPTGGYLLRAIHSNSVLYAQWIENTFLNASVRILKSNLLKLIQKRPALFPHSHVRSL